MARACRYAKLTYEAAELAGVVDVVRAIDHGL
jgi:hypothetical protein